MVILEVKNPSPLVTIPENLNFEFRHPTEECVRFGLFFSRYQVADRYKIPYPRGIPYK